MKDMLIVDDYEAIRKTFEEAVDSEEQKITSAINGEEAIAKVKETTPDIVLMDGQMPIMNGYIASIKLREKGYTGIILLHSSNPQNRYAKESGINYITKEKPINFGHLRIAADKLSQIAKNEIPSQEHLPDLEGLIKL